MFARVFCSLLESTSPESNRRANDAQHVIKFLQTRVIPELDRLSAKNLEAKCDVIKSILIMLMAEDMNDVGRWCISIIRRWYRTVGSWKDNFEEGLKLVVRRTRIMCIVCADLHPLDFGRAMAVSHRHSNFVG